MFRFWGKTLHGTLNISKYCICINISIVILNFFFFFRKIKINNILSEVNNLNKLNKCLKP